MYCNLPFSGLKNQLNSRNVKLCFEIFIAIDDLLIPSVHMGMWK